MNNLPLIIFEDIALFFEVLHKIVSPIKLPAIEIALIVITATEENCDGGQL
jgi:hypothetical protein